MGSENFSLVITLDSKASGIIVMQTKDSFISFCKQRHGVGGGGGGNKGIITFVCMSFCEKRSSRVLGVGVCVCVGGGDWRVLCYICYILLILLFLYGALCAHVRCKCRANTLLHYITRWVTCTKKACALCSPVL